MGKIFLKNKTNDYVLAMVDLDTETSWINITEYTSCYNKVEKPELFMNEMDNINNLSVWLDGCYEDTKESTKESRIENIKILFKRVQEEFKVLLKYEEQSNVKRFILENNFLLPPHKSKEELDLNKLSSYIWDQSQYSLVCMITTCVDCYKIYTIVNNVEDRLLICNSFLKKSTITNDIEGYIIGFKSNNTDYTFPIKIMKKEVDKNVI